MSPTSGPHFLVDPADVDGDVVVLRGADARHLAVVLRLRRGEPVSVADGSGMLYQTRVAVVGNDVRLAVVARIVAESEAPRLTVVHALPKGRKLDDVVQRLSEIGVAKIVPAHSARSEVRLSGERAAKAVTRWRAVARAAAKQSRRARLLEVSNIVEWADAFVGAQGVVLWEKAELPLTTVARGLGSDELLLAIGPEGGLTPEEVDVSGLPAASLGATILRTETAALVAATVVQTLGGRYGSLGDQPEMA